MSLIPRSTSARSRSTIAAYHARFPRRFPQRLRGDATPSNVYWNAAPPTDGPLQPGAEDHHGPAPSHQPRLFALEQAQRQRGREPLSLWKAIEAEPERMRQALPLQNRNAS